MANKSGAGRNGGGVALYITMAVGFIIIALVTAMALFFKISEISVEGAVKYTDREIIDASGIELDSSVLFLSASGAEVDIKTALPYVDSVKVVRKLPGTVTIQVTESVPVAAFESGGSWYITDSAFRILEKTDEAGVQGLMVLSGIAPVEPAVGKTMSLGDSESVRMRSLSDIMGSLEKWNMVELTTALDISNLSTVVMDCYGYKIKIGTAEELDAKFRTLMEDVFPSLKVEGSGQDLIYDERVVGFRYEP